jgi:hypothetical protein
MERFSRILSALLPKQLVHLASGIFLTCQSPNLSY